MPYMKNGKRDYKTENKKYNSSAEQKKKRALRNKARRTLERQGRVHKGDGKDVGHKVPLKRGGSNASSNLRVQSRRANRSHSINKASKGSRTPKRK